LESSNKTKVTEFNQKKRDIEKEIRELEKKVKDQYITKLYWERRHDEAELNI